jgi:hypothetical protein
VEHQSDGENIPILIAPPRICLAITVIRLHSVD